MKLPSNHDGGELSVMKTRFRLYPTVLPTSQLRVPASRFRLGFFSLQVFSGCLRWRESPIALLAFYIIPRWLEPQELLVPIVGLTIEAPVMTVATRLKVRPNAFPCAFLP